MKIFIYILAVLPAALPADGVCHACINGLCHYKEQIHEPPQPVTLVNILAVDYAAKLIYGEFHWNITMIGETIPEETAPGETTPGYTTPRDIIIEETNPGITITRETIPGETFIGYWKNRSTSIVNLGYTNDLYSCSVDQNSHDVYAASLQGNLKFNPNSTSQKPEHLSNSKTIQTLQYQNKLYLSDWTGLYTFENNTFFNVFHYFFVDDFVVDKNNDIYFKRSDEIWKFNSKTSHITLFDQGNFMLSVDQHGDAYLNTDKKLYKVVKSEAVEIGYFNLGKRIKPVFDWDDNILFVDSNKLYYLKTNNQYCAYKNGEIILICKEVCDKGGQCTCVGGE